MVTSNLNQRIHLISRPELVSEVGNFLTDRQARGLSPRTVAWYAEKLRPFCDFAKTQGISEVLSFTPDLLRRYVLSLAETHNAGGTHGHYRAMRAFLRWYETETEPAGWSNPIAKVREPRVSEVLLEPVNLKDLDKMLSTCERHTFTGDRDRALLFLMLDTGCRRAEVCALNIGDVNMQSGAVLVRHGKGDKVRSVFMGARTRRAMVAYLRHRPNVGDAEALWCTDEWGRLSHNGLREIVRRRAARAGVAEPALHSFRRGFALAALRGGCDLVSLQRLLGHADLSVIQRYVKQTQDDLQAAHAKAGPVDRLLR